MLRIRACVFYKEKYRKEKSLKAETVASINVSREESNELRENVVSDTKTEIPEGKFEDLVGHETAKTALIQSVILPVLQPQVISFRILFVLDTFWIV